jgi:hypothetical protein
MDLLPLKREENVCIIWICLYVILLLKWKKNKIAD